MIDAGELIAYRHNGFFRAMDTLKDKQILEDMVERANALAAQARALGAAAGGGRMRGLRLAEPGQHLSVLCLGAHSDDIEIGAGGTILQWKAAARELDVLWCVLSADRSAGEEARASAADFLEGAARARVEVHALPRWLLSRARAAEIKGWFEKLKDRCEPE